MFGTILISTLASIGMLTGEKVLPSFFPYVQVDRPETDDVLKHLEHQPQHSKLLRDFKLHLSTTTNITSEEETQAELLTLPLTEFVSRQGQNLNSQLLVAVQRSGHQFVQEIFPWEMYDLIVPKFVRLSSALKSGVQWFRSYNRDKLDVGGFLSRLESEDYYSAGMMAHQRSQHFWRCLEVERDLYAYTLNNSKYSTFRPLILKHMKYLRSMHSKWNGWRFKLYHMNYLLLRARQAQVTLKLKIDITDDMEKAAEYLEQIRWYERVINGVQVAFYNECLRKKGLNFLEKGLEGVIHLFSGTTAESGFKEQLIELERMLSETEETGLEALTVDPNKWDPDDWKIKPPNDFQRRFQDPSEGSSAFSFLFKLLTDDHIDTAKLFCKAIVRSQGKDSTWYNQLKLIKSYSELINHLFKVQKDIDISLKRLSKKSYTTFEKEVSPHDQSENAQTLPEIYDIMRVHEHESLLLYNAIVSLKWSLLKAVKDDFTKADASLWSRIVESAKRKGIRYATEGVIWDQTPDFIAACSHADLLIDHSRSILLRSRELFGEQTSEVDEDGFVIVRHNKIDPMYEDYGKPSMSSPLYWNSLGADLRDATGSAVEYATSFIPSSWTWGSTDKPADSDEGEEEGPVNPVFRPSSSRTMEVDE